MTDTAQVESTARARAENLVEELVENGDLDNLVHLARLVGSAQDALTDDMVTRLAGTFGGGLDMLDQANRSGLAKTLPALAKLVENGDLDRIVDLARLVGSAQDALTDDMIGRLARVASESMLLIDRLTRSDGFMRLIAVLEREDIQDTLTLFLEAVSAAHKEQQSAPAPKGGLGAMLRLAGDPDTQMALQLMANMGKHLGRG